METQRLVVHRRTIRVVERDWTALSFRPSETARFATNFFHDTWHLLSGVDSAHLLGRVFWSMAYQRKERTVFVIERTHLVPNPFDADPSTTIVIVNSDLGTPNHEVRKLLNRQVPWTVASEGRVTLRSYGFDRLDDWDDLRELDERSGEAFIAERHRNWINRVNGLLIFAAPALVLREWGLQLMGLRDFWYNGSSATRLDPPTDDGEMQVLTDFDERVDAALSARNQLFPGRVDLTDDERQQVWELGTALRTRSVEKESVS